MELIEKSAMTIALIEQAAANSTTHLFENVGKPLAMRR
jgi:hypothetical protein